MFCAAAVESETPLKTVRRNKAHAEQTEAGERFRKGEKEAGVFYWRPCGDVSSPGHELNLD